jgi:hypothetical protein
MRYLTLACAVLLVGVPSTGAMAQAVQADSTPPIVRPRAFTQAQDGPSTRARVVTGIGAGVIGAALGFFASQVVQGDWQEQLAREPVNRGLWAAVGGAVGFSVGFRFPLRAAGGVAQPPGFPTGREHIGIREFEGRGFENAHQVVSLLRPEWLQIRGARSLAAGIDPVVVGGTNRAGVIRGTTPLISERGTIHVYVDNVRLGGLENLRSIQVMIVRDIYFFGATQATARWGGGHPHGAILIIT